MPTRSDTSGKDQSAQPIGILSGGGGLPLEIAHSIRARGGAVHIVRIDGEADADFSPFPSTVVNWGQIGRMVATFRRAGCQDLVIVGRVKRPDLRKIRPDLGLLISLPKIIKLITAGGDDGVLRRVVRFFESKGFRVLGPGAAAPEIIAGEGSLGVVEPMRDDLADAETGSSVIAALGAFDIGQATVVRGGRLIAIEGAEGTDGMLRRLAAAAPVGGQGRDVPRGGVLVKRPKPGQELRIDMPTIGPDTIARAVEAGLSGVAVAAGNVLIAERAKVRAAADAAGLFVLGIAVSDTSAPARGAAVVAAADVGMQGAVEPSPEAMADAERGRAALEALAPYAVSEGCVVIRRHVLGLEAGEGRDALMERVGALRQWGDRGRNRRGVLVAAGRARLSKQHVDAVARMGLAGIVLLDTAAEQDAIRLADERGVFIAAVRIRGAAR